MKKNFNYHIANYFVGNQRLTILSLVLLIALGIGSVFLLKTSGFPSPEIKVALIVTTYPGASADTVLQKVTQPLEGSVKDVAGVRAYSSTSRNSVSIIRIDMTDDANADSVRSKLASVVSSVTLPDGVNTPEVSSPEISGPDYIVSVAGTNLEQLYSRYEALRQDLTELPDTASVEAIVDLRRFAVIQTKADQLAVNNLRLSDIQTAVNSFTETIPVAGGVTIDEQNQSLQTVITGNSLDDLKALPLTAGVAQPTVRLADVADVSFEYHFADTTTPVIGVNSADEAITLPAVTLQIKTARGTNLTDYSNKLADLARSYPETSFILPGDEAQVTTAADHTWILQHYTSKEFNDRQVNEVVSGLIGGPLDISGPAANLGWILGGIQLVFLVMLAFVSWRAALVAAAAIPLSLLFSTIYLYFTGNDLNTLVLFSLVLVIGLVVDPALVILESIQRKIDAGLTGKAATLAAVEDVGMGLFLATVTNIIVFFPFAAVSGLLGEIFSYIPLTIIPATIGSYIVPLIFLAWFGGIFLKPAKKAHTSTAGDEVQNLWGVARWLITTNERILRSAVWVRCLIIVIALAVPVAVAGWYFSSGKMKVVQFASGRNADYIDVHLTYANQTPSTERSAILDDMMKTVVVAKGVRQIFPLAAGGQYYVALDSAKERGDYLALDISADLSEDLAAIRSRVYDVTTSVDFVGPPKTSFQLSLAVTSPDAAIRRTAAEAVGKTLQLVCNTNDVITVTADCAGDRMVTKVNDGYTDQINSIIAINLNKEALLRNQLVIPNVPVSVLANQAIKQLYPDYTRDTRTITLDGVSAQVLVRTDVAQPSTVEAIKNIVLYQTPLFTLRLGDVATIETVEDTASIVRTNGATQAIVLGRLQDKFNDQIVASKVTAAVVDYYAADNGKHLTELGLPQDAVSAYSEGATANDNKSFQELFIALGLAIVLSYIVLAVFFGSFTQPLVVLFAVPLSFLGIFPALAHLGNGQFGFLEIIGMIILVGIVENVAIFLLDAARQKQAQGWDEIKAISYAAGVRLRPVLLTKFTAIASLAPLAALSETYRSISLVIMFGLLTSGFTSLFTTPILYIFFRWLSRHFHAAAWWNKILFFLLSPIYLLVWVIQDHRAVR